MRISDWSSDVCSSDLSGLRPPGGCAIEPVRQRGAEQSNDPPVAIPTTASRRTATKAVPGGCSRALKRERCQTPFLPVARQLPRSEEHTSELQSLMRNSYAVFCLKKKTKKNKNKKETTV